MRKRVIHLSYFFSKYFDIETYSYCKNLYFSDSFFIEFYIYRRLFYALNLANLDEINIILDFGCGDGPFLPTLNRDGKKIVGLDFRLDFLINARKLINFKKYPLKRVVLLNADGLNLPFKDNSIDTIFCLETFEHIPNSPKLINEIYRVLKNSGNLFYSIPNEIGMSLIIRRIIGKIINFTFESYTLKELLINGILKKPPKRINNHLKHKNFDWRIIQRLINKKFQQEKITYSPLPFLKKINPTIIFKVSK